jgi:hypothetical protein
MGSISDDDDDVNRIRGDAISRRYRVCHPDRGMCETTSTRQGAFEVADTLAATGRFSDPYAFEIHDSMACFGSPQWWRRQPHWVHAGDPGDYVTRSAHFKCVGRRGLPDPTPLDFSWQLRPCFGEDEDDD